MLWENEEAVFGAEPEAHLLFLASLHQATINLLFFKWCAGAWKCGVATGSFMWKLRSAMPQIVPPP